MHVRIRKVMICALIAIVAVGLLWSFYKVNQPTPEKLPDELKKVITHYQDQHDTLKIKAAQFLINNMKGNGSDVSILTTNKGDAYKLIPGQTHNLWQLADSLKLYYSYQFKSDEQSIKADFLIKQIDLAFTQQKLNPYSHFLNFEDFCEYVLPYRINQEPLEDWRNAVYTHLNWVKDSLGNGCSPEKIICLINKQIESKFRYGKFHYKNDNSLSYTELLSCQMGECDAMANLVLFSMRAFGFPVMKDFTPVWANANGGHSWNAIYLKNRQLHSFMGCESCPDTLNPNPYFPFDKKGNRISNRYYHRSAKVYRYRYSYTHNRLFERITDSNQVPPFFRTHTRIIDVTHEYMPTLPIKVKLNNSKTSIASNFQNIAYLCVFNNGYWVPVEWGKVEDTGEVVFPNMGKDIVYMTAFYKNGEILPATDPFYLSESGQITYLTLNKKFTQQLTLTKRSYKYPENRITNGQIYVLYAWDKNKWIPISQQMALANSLLFSKIPSQGLYQLRLKNELLGRERPFLVKNKQVLWK